MSEPLLVIDTNVVLDFLYFDDPASRPLRQALEAGRVRAAVTPATLAEWLHVLAYPQFGLDAGAQRRLADRYRSLCTVFESVAVQAMPHKGTPTRYRLKPMQDRMPRCKDGDDQKFLDLAAQLGAPLVSKDRAVLKLRRLCAPRFAILTPDEVPAWLSTVCG
ncbi:MAG: PIN domain-containing protein [Pseudomonadota bacterium]